MNGSVDFREFLIGLSLLSQPANNEETIKYAFKLFNRDDKKYIERDDLQLILFSAFSMNVNDVDNIFKSMDKDQDGKVNYGTSAMQQ